MELFRNPAYLAWLALAAGASAGLAAWSENRRSRLAALFASAQILPRLYPASALRHRRLKYILKACALGALLAALAGPQWGVELTSTQTKGIQVVIAIDTSLSMLAEDVKPSRMEAAKNELSELIDELKGARVGLVAFAGEAQIQCPLTTDSEAVKSFLRRVAPGIVSPPGTAIGRALELGASMLKKYPGQKALVLLTDGEDHGSRPLEAARAAAAQGVHVYIAGIGTPEGEPIPVRDSEGRIAGYKKDAKGQTVITRLTETDLVQIAAASSGSYYRVAGAGNEASQIAGQISSLEKSTVESASVNRYRNRYRIPLALALLLLLAELLLPEGGWPQPAKNGAAGILAKAASLSILVLFTAGWSGPSRYELWKGNSLYQKENYAEALKEYQAAAEKRPEDPAPMFNSGAALYKMGEYEEARKIFERLSDPSGPRGLAGKSLYNMGNTLYRKQQFKEAALAYRRCLLLNPEDENCRYNLVLALKPPPPSKNKKQDQDKKDNKDQQNPDKPRPQPPKSQQRPDSGQGLSREDAERILAAVKEKEKAAAKPGPQQPQDDKRPGAPEEDW